MGLFSDAGLTTPCYGFKRGEQIYFQKIITSNLDFTGVAVLVEYYTNADGLMAELLSTTTDLVAGVGKSTTTINGDTPINFNYNGGNPQGFYIKITLAHASFGTKTYTESFTIEPIRAELDITIYSDSGGSAEAVTFSPGASIYVNGTALFDGTLTACSFYLKAMELDYTPIETFMSKGAGVTKDVPKTVSEINDGSLPRWDTTDISPGLYIIELTAVDGGLETPVCREMVRLSASGVTLGDVSCDAYTKTLGDSVTFTVGVSQTADILLVVLDDGSTSLPFVMTKTVGVDEYTTEISCKDIGIGTFDITYYAVLNLQGSSKADSSQLTISATASGDYLNTMLSALETSLQTEFGSAYDIYRLGNPRHTGVSMPTIIIRLESSDTGRYMLGGGRILNLQLSFLLKIKDGYLESEVGGEQLANKIYERIQNVVHDERDWGGLAITGVKLVGAMHQVASDANLTVYEAKNAIEIGLRVR